MFDRVLDITDRLTKQGFDRKITEKAVLIYRDQGPEKAASHLLTEVKWTKEQAVHLVREIDRLYISTNRQILVFYAVLVILLLGLVVLGIYSSFYFLLVLSGLFLLSRGITLIKFIRKNRFKRHPFSHQPESIAVK